VSFEPARWRDRESRRHLNGHNQRNAGVEQVGNPDHDAGHMIRPGIAAVALALVVNGQATIWFVMVRHIKRNFGGGMGGLMRRPSR